MNPLSKLKTSIMAEQAKKFLEAVYRSDGQTILGEWAKDFAVALVCDSLG